MLKDEGGVSSLEELQNNARQVTITRRKSNGLGINIRGGSDYYGLPIVVAKVYPNGPSVRLLQLGDVILSVNNVDIWGVTHEEAVAVLNNAGDEVTLLVSLDENLRETLMDGVDDVSRMLAPEYQEFVPTHKEYPWSKDPLPDGWFMLKCPDTGRLYFSNRKDKSTTWLDPRSAAYMKDISHCKPGELPYGWEEVTNSNHEIYYVNHVTQQAQWKHPNPIHKKPWRL